MIWVSFLVLFILLLYLYILIPTIVIWDCRKNIVCFIKRILKNDVIFWFGSIWMTQTKYIFMCNVRLKFGYIPIPDAFQAHIAHGCRTFIHTDTACSMTYTLAHSRFWEMPMPIIYEVSEISMAIGLAKILKIYNMLCVAYA